MVFLDVIILIVWSLRDPLKKKALKLTSELIEKEDIIYEPEIEICKCNNEIVWIGNESHTFSYFVNTFKNILFFMKGVTFSIKGLVLILGLYLSYETRNSNLDMINDSKFVALSIYNIVVCYLDFLFLKCKTNT